MKRSYTIKRECVVKIIGGLETRSMSLQDIEDYLSENDIIISPGELQGAGSSFYG